MFAIFVLNYPDKFPQIEDKFVYNSVRKKTIQRHFDKVYPELIEGLSASTSYN